MKNLKYLRLATVVCLLLVTSELDGQTLFASPDTSPDYHGYQHIEECLQAGYRVSSAYRTSLDSIWFDTVSREMYKQLFRDRKDTALARRPKAAIDTTYLCLKKFEPDTVKLVSLGQVLRIVKILLVAHRDDDAERTAQRFLGSLLEESEKHLDPTQRTSALSQYKGGLARIMTEYGVAVPVRYEAVKQYYGRLLQARVGDPSYHTIDAARNMFAIASKVGDSVARDEAARFAIRVNDSTPVQERLNAPGANNRLAALMGYMAGFTQDEALDSIAVSTVAYNLWWANTVRRRVVGGDIVTQEKAVSKKFPEIGGAFHYIADNMSPGTIRNGMGKYTSRGAVQDNEFPIKNRINLFRSVPVLCYTQTHYRTDDDRRIKSSQNECISYAADIRQFKRDYPEIEIVGLSATYGTVGRLGPLKPDQEADTLAKLFLGFHHLPIHLVIENTEFYHLVAPDNRRIDIKTTNSEVLGSSVLNPRLRILTDKEGYMLNVPSITQAWFKRFYEILRDRKSP